MDVARTIEQRIDGLHEYSRDRCIYRVPVDLREINDQAYTPKLVSIGPLHRSNPSLLPMEDHKLRYLRFFLRNSLFTLSQCVDIVRRNEERIRACYAEPTPLSSDSFIQMVLIDSVFIIEIFRRHLHLYDSASRQHNDDDDDDCLYKEPYMLNTALRDIKLEENQLPYFILDELWQAAAFSPNVAQTPSFTQVACDVLGVNKFKVNGRHFAHLLDLLRCNYNYDYKAPRMNQADENGESDHETIPTVTTLYETNVEFKVTSSGVHSSDLLQIRFDSRRGVLAIPKLRLKDQTECEFRNLVAFEQCHYRRKDTHFSDYVYFWYKIINTPEDVRILAEKGVIESWLGSDKEACNLINSLGKNMELDMEKYNYRRITKQLITHSQTKSNKYWAILWRTYLGNPWSYMSVCVGIILLFLTGIQTVMALWAYIQPRN